MTQVGTLTNSLVLISDYLYQKFKDNMANLEIEDVYYGDQDKIARPPAICVEPADIKNLLKQAAAARRIDIEFYISFLCYHSEITSGQSNRRNADRLAERVAALVHADRTLGGLVIHGYCTDVHSGYATKGNTLMRANKIDYYAKSQFDLPS